MRPICNWVAQARNLSHRSRSGSEPEPKARRSLTKTSGMTTTVTTNEKGVGLKITESLRPCLMEDGSHPYFPGTPWNKLELASTIDEACKPQNDHFPTLISKRSRVFGRKPKS